MAERHRSYMKRKRQVQRQLLLIGMIIGVIIVVIVSCSVKSGEKKQDAKKKPQTEQVSKSIEKIETPGERLQRVRAEAEKKGYPKEIIKLLDKNPETVEYVENYEKMKDKPYAPVVSEKLVKGELPFIMQWDARWGYAPYGTGNIATAGCGPTCMSMIISGLTGDASVTPVVVAKFAEENNLLDEENNTYWNLMPEASKNWGISCYEGKPDESVVSKELKAGHPVMFSVRPGDFTQTGHFIILTEYKEGKVKVYDPFSKKNTDKLWNYAEIQDQIKGMWVFSYDH